MGNKNDYGIPNGLGTYICKEIYGELSYKADYENGK